MLFRFSAALLATCIVLPLSDSSASAESRGYPRKSQNFGSSSASGTTDSIWNNRSRRKKKSTTFGSFNFFDNGRGFFSTRDDAQVFEEQLRKRQKNRARQTVTLDSNDGPDAATSGESYYTYKADALVKLADPELKQPKPPAPVFASAAGATVNGAQFLAAVNLSDPVAQAMFELVQQSQTNISLAKDQVPALISAYEKRAFAPRWSVAGKPTPQALKLLKTLQKADQEGLNPENYEVAVVGKAGSASSLAGDPATLARFDLELSAMALRFSAHASGGMVNPNRISGYHDLNPPTVAAADAVASLFSHPEPADWLMGLHPVLPAYAAMKAELVRLGAGGSEPEPIVMPTGPLLKPGMKDDRVLVLRARLKQLKFLINTDKVVQSTQQTSDAPLFGSEAAVLASDTEDRTFNDADEAALKAFQKSAGLTADGLVGNQTVNALNGNTNSPVKREEQLALNMERLRWLPRDLGERYVFVNQPAFEMKIINKGATEWSTRVIVGKPSNQTFFFSDEMERVEFNPYWGVPQSIIKGEYLKKLRANPSYLDQRGYETIRNGRVVSSSAVDWWNYKGGVGVRQKPGSSNALGEVKFMFPNKHAIYLHDTPKRSLFDNGNRAYSHGCVRVQNPRDLATHILGWSEAEVASTISTGKNLPVKLTTKLPVHLTYFTAWIGEDGELSYFSDVYGRDGYLQTAWKTENAALR